MNRPMVTPSERRLRTPHPGEDRGLAQHPALVGALVVLIFAGYIAARISDTPGEPPNLAPLFPLGLLSGASVVLWMVGRRPAPGQTAQWTPLAAGLTLWAGAACFDAVAPRLALSNSTIISPLLMIGANVCWMVALFHSYSRQPVRLNLTALLDGVLVLGCGITVAGNSVLGPLWGAGEPAIFPFAQAVVGLGLFAALVVLRYIIVEPLPVADALALTGVLVALVSESWHLWSAQALPAATEPGLGTLRIAAGLLFLAGGYEALAAPGRPRTPLWERIAHWLPLVCLSAVSGLLVLHFSGHPLPNVVFGAAISSLSLAVLRLGFALGENHRLRREQNHLRSQNEEYIRLAISDPLTGLFNKGYFDYRLHEEFIRSDGYGQPLTLIALDLDNFKQVNDRYGHAAGDSLLVAVSSALRATSRAGDTPCRCGGDEFMLILPQTSIEQGEGVAERLRLAINQVFQQQGLSPLVSVSVGLAAHPGGAATAADLALRADQALYFAKQCGKNRCARWTPAIPHQLAAPVLPGSHPGWSR